MSKSWETIKKQRNKFIYLDKIMDIYLDKITV